MYIFGERGDKLMVKIDEFRLAKEERQTDGEDVFYARPTIFSAD